MYRKTWAWRCLWFSWVANLTRLRLGRGSVLECMNWWTIIGVHVLHAFQKKSKSGIATPRPDVELIEKRLKAVLSRYGLSGRK